MKSRVLAVIALAYFAGAFLVAGGFVHKFFRGGKEQGKQANFEARGSTHSDRLAGFWHNGGDVRRLFISPAA
jgi:hypothetical protein